MKDRALSTRRCEGPRPLGDGSKVSGSMVDIIFRVQTVMGKDA